MLADPSQPALRFVHEILVAELEVAAAGELAESPSGEDLGPPPRGELRGGVRLRPRLAGEALGELEEGKRGVTPVADEMHPARVREELFEQRQLLHVERRLVAPA